MATSFSQGTANTAFLNFLGTQETALRDKINQLGTKTEPPSQQEMLAFQLNMQAFTFMGQFASSVQKELHDAVKSIVSRL